MFTKICLLKKSIEVFKKIPNSSHISKYLNKRLLCFTLANKIPSLFFKFVAKKVHQVLKNRYYLSLNLSIVWC